MADSGMSDKEREVLAKKAMAKLLGLGPTGRFPEGKLNETDEGELRIAVGKEGGNVIVHFGKSIAWLALPPDLAMELAGRIGMHAEDIKYGRDHGRKVKGK